VRRSSDAVTVVSGGPPEKPVMEPFSLIGTAVIECRASQTGPEYYA